jgi:hypothetical protein
MNAFRQVSVLLPIALFALAGCALRPAGEDAERSRAAEAGRPDTDTIVLPLLSENSTPQDYLSFAFLRNANLHTRYWEWRAAIERIPQDSSFPNIALPFSVMFNNQNMTLWNRTTVGLSNTPMAMTPFPTKLTTAGREDSAA